MILVFDIQGLVALLQSEDPFWVLMEEETSREQRLLSPTLH
jgi:hypothetical protein